MGARRAYSGAENFIRAHMHLYGRGARIYRRGRGSLNFELKPLNIRKNRPTSAWNRSTLSETAQLQTKTAQHCEKPLNFELKPLNLTSKPLNPGANWRFNSGRGTIYASTPPLSRKMLLTN